MKKVSKLAQWQAHGPVGESAKLWLDEVDGPVIKTSSGLVQGVVHEGIHIFRGIPYAVAPVGQRRWRPSQLKQPWTGLYEAKTYGAIQPQAISRRRSMSEDSLCLNIWTPSLSSEEKGLPVYVFIHGGAMAFGSGSESCYEGTALAKQGLILVTFNYRLNALGFFPSKETYTESGTYGNWGLWDCLTLLRWVQKNIAVFGGDPKRVTIGGQSAGAFMASALLTCPQAKGLFQQCILESGSLVHSPIMTASSTWSFEKTEVFRKSFMDKLGVTDSKEGLAKMRSLSLEEIEKAIPHIKEYPYPLNEAHFWPLADDALIPRQLMHRLQQGQVNNVPLLVGYTTTELEAYTPSKVTKEMLRKLVASLFPHAKQEAWTHVEALLAKCQQEGLEGPTFMSLTGGWALAAVEKEIDLNHKTVEDLMIKTIYIYIGGLATLRSGIYEYVKAVAAKGQAVYAYQFNFKDPFLIDDVGVRHASELPYIFQAHPEDWMGSQEAAYVGRITQTAWVQFIKTGNPNGGCVDGWAPFDSKKPIEYCIQSQPKCQPIWRWSDVERVNQWLARNEIEED